MAWPYHCLRRDAGGNRTHLNRVAAGRLAIWLQRQASSPGVEPGLRPSRGRVQIPHTSRTCLRSAPCRGIEPRPAVSRTAVLSGTPAGLLDRVSRPGLEPGPGASEAPMRSATPSGRTSKSRRLDLHQHRAVYRTAAFLFGHVGTSSSAGSRTWSSTFAGSRANPPHSEDVFLLSAPPRN